MATGISLRAQSASRRRRWDASRRAPLSRDSDVNLQREKSMDTSLSLRLTAYRIFIQKMCHMPVQCWQTPWWIYRSMMMIGRSKMRRVVWTVKFTAVLCGVIISVPLINFLTNVHLSAGYHYIIAIVLVSARERTLAKSGIFVSKNAYLRCFQCFACRKWLPAASLNFKAPTTFVVSIQLF